MNINAFPSCLSYFYFIFSSFKQNAQHFIFFAVWKAVRQIVHDKIHRAWISTQFAKSMLLAVLTHLCIPVKSVGAAVSCSTQKTCPSVNSLWREKYVLWVFFHSSVSVTVIIIFNTSRHWVLTWFLKLVKFLLSIKVLQEFRSLDTLQ